MNSKMPGSSEFVAGADPLPGTWKPNLVKSDYRAVPMESAKEHYPDFLGPPRG